MTTVQVLTPREVPLGGTRALDVRRTLPHRERSFVGAWCFADHYGPCDVGPDSGMDVPPHPHTGLATVSWLFEGEIEHRDSAGVVGTVRPGEVNLMTAGHGIAHSEVSTGASAVLHGVQLWIALPADAGECARGFQHHAPPVIERDGLRARVFVGSLLGRASPVRTATALLGAQLDLDPGVSAAVDVDPAFEHAVLLDTGEVAVEGTTLAPGELGVIDPGPSSLRLTAGSDGARLVLLGGEPFEDEVVMWWNFMAPDHEGIVRARDQWEAASDRFGEVPGYPGGRLPAPPLPPVRLRPRGRSGRLLGAEPPAAS
ncbi:pirin family protein [Agilicoccus flavus]|uniref:pirin family protein n=1 Tax=Agilicoccus flavus TaxID=2775968 RepID=UPI001CF698CA|nr:pirin family protein [Agilicoccus flavus]